MGQLIVEHHDDRSADDDLEAPEARRRPTPGGHDDGDGDRHDGRENEDLEVSGTGH
jgi:hypothetical protein